MHCGTLKTLCHSCSTFVETFVWKQAITTGTPPSARDSHTCSSWRDKIIVIGGEDGHDYYLSDVHILDTGFAHYFTYYTFACTYTACACVCVYLSCICFQTHAHD